MSVMMELVVIVSL